MSETNHSLELIGDGGSGATFDPDDDRYRYTLWRRWWFDCGLDQMVVFIGLNPSVADAERNDPTIRRCVAFAKRWGMGGMIMLNLFAFHATDSGELAKVEDPVGPLNDVVLLTAPSGVGKVICCWGTLGGLHDRDVHVLAFLNTRLLWCFGRTFNGHPKHPLYLAKDHRLRRYRP